MVGLHRTDARFQKFWPNVKRQRWLLTTSVALLVIATAAETIGIMLFGIITDRVLSSGSLTNFWAPAAEWLTAAIVGGAAMFGGNYLCAVAGERFVLRLRDELFDHVQRLPPRFFDRRPVGDLIVRLTADIEEIEAFVVSGMIQLISSIISIAVFAGAAIYLRWDLALVAFGIAPLLWLAVRLLSRRITDAAAVERASYGELSAVAEESLSNMAIVQAYNRERTEQRRYHRVGLGWKRARLRESRLTACYDGLVEVVETVCVVAILGVGGWEISAHRLTLGGLLSFAGFIGHLYPPLQNVGQLSLTMATARAGAARIGDIVAAQPAVHDLPGITATRKARGRIEVCDASFRYADTDIVDRLSFAANPGELITITGPSGSGKSTIARLLLRYYDPDRGVVKLDGTDIKALPLDYVRNSITLLMQETLIFDGSVHDNIAFGRQDATAAEIEAAARKAEADTFIKALPLGYHTTIGQRGRLLSGGQRQRIAIARAIVRDSPVLVLDEPTAGLDAITARRIMQPLRELMAGRTTILITHDLHLAPPADRLITLDAAGRFEGVFR